MSSEREIFCRALEVEDPQARRAFLEQACGLDLKMRERIEGLLIEHENAGAFLSGEFAEAAAGQGWSATAALSEGPGTVIGRYKLLQKIGEGGFGIVYMAEQREPIRRRVALKIIKLGMDTRQVVGRFEAERQALALMDHPNIARVLDGGATETGRPYFVMELVRGVPITQHCDEQKLTTQQRLQLFIQVCGAIQHAHQKGIVHRDIKPSNVLVTMHDDQPVPKVIDFGVAKAMQQDLTDKTIFTRFHEFIGTPAYMSPEQTQLSGLDIDTRSDIYSLGVLLYELLTGQTPLDSAELTRAGYDEMRRRIREVDPPRPSTRLRTLQQEHLTQLADLRRSDPNRLSRLLRGDLDWIVLKAMEKDRSRRYESAGSLANDVRRFLKNEPVTAAAPTFGYKFGKFARRHRVVLTASLVLVGLLVSGVLVSTYFAVQARRAEHRARQEAAIAAAVNRFLNDDLFAQGDSEVEVDSEIKLRTLVERAGRRIENQFTNAPLVEAAIRTTIGRTLTSLGEYQEAAPHFRRAWELRDRHQGAQDPGTIQALSDLAMSQLTINQTAQARQTAETALDLARLHLGERHPLTVSILCRLCRVYYRVSDEPAMQAAATKATRLIKEVEGVPVGDQLLALDVLGRIIGRTGRFEEGESYLRDALELAERMLGPTHSQTLKTKQNLAAYYYNVGIKSEEAERLYLEALRHYRRAFGEAHATTLMIRGNLALLYSRSNRLDAAAHHQLRVIEYESKTEPPHALAGLRAWVGTQQPWLDPARGSGWQFSTTPPPPGWNHIEFDASQWQTNAHPVGGAVWLRHVFELDQVPSTQPVLVIRNNGNFSAYLNGRPVHIGKVWKLDRFQPVVCTTEALRVLRAGRNVLAVEASELDPKQPIDIQVVLMPATEPL